MEDMTARKLLGREIRTLPSDALPWVMDDHFFTTYYASPVIHRPKFFFSCIRVTLIHIASCCLVTMQCSKPRNEGPCSHVNITDDVQRQTIECDDNQKEDQISS